MNGWRIARWPAVALAVLLVLPYLITPLYLFVPPVSTPMLWRYLTLQRVERSIVPIAAVARALPQARHPLTGRARDPGRRGKGRGPG